MYAAGMACEENYPLFKAFEKQVQRGNSPDLLNSRGERLMPKWNFRT
jgi:hypothetical protein